MRNPARLIDTRNPLAIGVLIAFAVVLIVLLVVALSLDDAEDIAHAEFALRWISRGIGLFIATVAAVALLAGSLSALPLGRLLTFVLPLLGGMLLVEVHWALALALGASALTFLVQRWIVRPAARRVPPVTP